MAKKYLRMIEVIEVCGVDEEFVLKLEQERLIEPVNRRRQKLYPLEQVERVRVAHTLIADLGVNLEGAEVILHMREQMIAMQREFRRAMHSLLKQINKE